MPAINIREPGQIRMDDVVVVGAGIVGLATAFRILERSPGSRVHVLEKEAGVGLHQTSHNSGVLHSGIYYRPGSLRALNCASGRTAMVDFCEREGITHDICGKVIVAVDESELDRLQIIFARGKANCVRCELIEPERLAELEPHVRGVRAIHVPDAGIVDFLEVARALARRVQEAGGTITTSQLVQDVDERSESVVVRTSSMELESKLVVTCGGLHSDRLARMSEVQVQARIVPFRGEYYALTPEAAGLCRNLIYPVPDPAFPFLGVHFTRMISGDVECGPNAVLAMAREGYTKTSISPRDLFDALSYPGFLRLVGKHWRAAAGEVHRSFSKSAFVEALQQLIPELRKDHLVRAPSGVRAQAVAPDGSLVDDFLFRDTPRVINVCNAPSPAATSSLNIGNIIADKVFERSFSNAG